LCHDVFNVGHLSGWNEKDQPKNLAVIHLSYLHMSRVNCREWELKVLSVVHTLYSNKYANLLKMKNNMMYDLQKFDSCHPSKNLLLNL
jgi:hypothetical protein